MNVTEFLAVLLQIVIALTVAVVFVVKAMEALHINIYRQLTPQTRGVVSQKKLPCPPINSPPLPYSPPKELKPENGGFN